jgi:hypothetical protein
MQFEGSASCDPFDDLFLDGQGCRVESDLKSDG